MNPGDAFFLVSKKPVLKTKKIFLVTKTIPGVTKKTQCFIMNIFYRYGDYPFIYLIFTRYYVILIFRAELALQLLHVFVRLKIKFFVI